MGQASRTNSFVVDVTANSVSNPFFSGWSLTGTNITGSGNKVAQIVGSTSSTQALLTMVSDNFNLTSGGAVTMSGAVAVGDAASIAGIVTIGGSVTGTNLNSLTARRGTSGTVALAASTNGNAGALLFNSALISQTSDMAASGSIKYLGVTGSVRPGMIRYRANNADFAFMAGETGLSEGAAVTTWTSLFTIQSSGNLVMSSAGTGGGSGVIAILNRLAAPTTNPTGGGVLYAEAGSLRWRGSSGTVTILAPA
jgi:hypothetical protein